MSVATTLPAHLSSIRIPVLTPMYGAPLDPFCAQIDGTYRCGYGAANEFGLEFSGAEATHCCFIRKAGTFSVKRLDGRVWVNDLPVSGVNRLTEGDVISLGPVSYRLEFQDAPSYLPEPGDRPSMSFKPAAIVAPGPFGDLTSVSLPIPAVTAAPSAQETFIQTALQKELEEHQRLLTLRQQQLAELTEIVRERERDADSRLIAIEERSSRMTAQWNELALRQEQLTVQERESAQRLLEADQQRQTLADQQRQLAVAAEQNSQTLVAVEQAKLEYSRQESELRALHAQIEAAHAELLNRESLQQERESKYQQLSDDYASREASLSLRALELQTKAEALSLHEVALSDRAKALADAAQNPAPVASVSADLRRLEQLAAIEAKREELDRREAEIFAAEERFAETRKSADSIVQAAESERTALLSANKDLLCERNALSQLRQDLVSRESGIADREVLVARQLEDMRSRFAVLDLRTVELKHHESEIDSRAADVHRRVQQFKSDRQVHRETNRVELPVDESNSAFVGSPAELLAVRQQLDEMQQALTATDDARASMLAEREALLSAVRELQKALQDARQDVEDANRLKSESGFQEQRLQQAYQSIEEHSQSRQLSESKLRQACQESELLRAELADSVCQREELHAKLAEFSLSTNFASPVQQAGAGADSADSCETQSRDLDRRAELLDRREEELRERARKIVLTEGDIESQRRLLLEARQQLELARAEIQVAMRKQTELPQHADSHLPGQQFGSSFAGEHKSDRHVSDDANLSHDTDCRESNDSSYVPATDLRSELAGLFGMRKPAAESVTPPPLPSAAFVDLSEPSGENQSVVFHFGSAAAQLTATDSKQTIAADAEPAREENSDDVVRDYMEQLLSRNRKSAGTALPGELKAADKKKDPAAASAGKVSGGPSPKSPPKVISYIEQYMAGNMGNLDNDEPQTMSEANIETRDLAAFDEKRPIPLRPKMDLLKLKENMASFRSLSEQSVENALASHAIKLERLGFSGRVVFAALLVLSSVLLGIANYYGAIDAPMLTWVTLTSAIAILTELYRRYQAIAVHTRYPLDLVFRSGKPKGLVAQSARLTATVVAESACEDDMSVNDECVVPSWTIGHSGSLPVENLVS